MRPTLDEIHNNDLFGHFIFIGHFSSTTLHLGLEAHLSFVSLSKLQMHFHFSISIRHVRSNVISGTLSTGPCGLMAEIRSHTYHHQLKPAIE